jgi:hypothetical protein
MPQHSGSQNWKLLVAFERRKPFSTSWILLARCNHPAGGAEHCRHNLSMLAREDHVDLRLSMTHNHINTAHGLLQPLDPFPVGPEVVRSRSQPTAAYLGLTPSENPCTTAAHRSCMELPSSRHALDRGSATVGPRDCLEGADAALCSSSCESIAVCRLGVMPACKFKSYESGE